VKPGTRLQILAAALLAISGVLTFLYAGFVPIPPISDVPVPLAFQLIGVIELAAALGVFLGQTWGRAIGLGIIAIDLTLLVFWLISEISGSNLLGAVLNATVKGVVDVFVLWVLLRRWDTRS
jgi:hypothetical protein